MKSRSEGQSASIKEAGGAAPPREFVRDLYRRRARFYDVSANMYYLIGYREWAYREWTVEALNLDPGDTVVELGCGTGLNFPLIRDRIGETGRLIGVDCTHAMLRQARRRVERHGWKNIELIQQDASRFVFPNHVQGVISSFAISLLPPSDIDRLVKRSAGALDPNRRMAVLDLKVPSGWGRYLKPLAWLITRPFGVTWDLIQSRPWIPLRRSFDRYFETVTYEECYVGFSYRLTGFNP